MRAKLLPALAGCLVLACAAAATCRAGARPSAALAPARQVAGLAPARQVAGDAPKDAPAPEPPVPLKDPTVIPELQQVQVFIRADKARAAFAVSGKGLTVAVIDSGLRTTHVDFAGRVAAQRNFTKEGTPDNADDGNGHGTNVGGIIVANKLHVGIAPGASIIPLKVFPKKGGASFAVIGQAVQWVVDHREKFNITAVCMSLGDSGNYTSDKGFSADAMRANIAALRKANVAVVVAAGNDFFSHKSKQGMSYPAVLRETISVGAVYDADEGGFSYASGASCKSSGPGVVTPFTQRLHQSAHAQCRTDIFAPGAPVTSSGIGSDKGESVQHGTSQATPVTAGVVLLIQEYHLRRTGKLPSVDNLETWLRRGSVAIKDGDNEDDNVENTNLTFRRLDALLALDAVRRHLQREALGHGDPKEK